MKCTSWWPPPASSTSFPIWARGSFVNFVLLLPLLVTLSLLSITAKILPVKFTFQTVALKRKRSLVDATYLSKGYKFFLLLFLWMVWPPSSLIRFFWSSLPVSVTKRFLFRSLQIPSRDKYGVRDVTAIAKCKPLFRHHFIILLCWLSPSPSSPMRSRTAEDACASKALPSPLKLRLKKKKKQKEMAWSSRPRTFQLSELFHDAVTPSPSWSLWVCRGCSIPRLWPARVCLACSLDALLLRPD